MKAWTFVGALVLVGLAVGVAMSWRELATLTESPIPGPPPDEGSPAAAAAGAKAGSSGEAAGGAAGAAPGDQASERRPKVFVEEPEFNFGAGRHRQSGVHGWRIWNKGDGLLRIRDSWVECTQCTKLIVPASTIPPGESIEVKLEYTLITLQEDFRKSATLLTNDPDQPMVVLRLVGKVYHPLEVKPASLSFSGLKPAEQAAGSVLVLAHFTRDFQIKAISLADATLADQFQVQPRPLAASELPEGALAGYELQVTVKPGLPLGDFRQTILLDTNLDEPSRVEIPVQGSITSPITVIGTNGWNPGRGVLKLGLVPREEGVVRTLKLMFRGVGQANLRLEPPRAHPDLLQVSYGVPSEIKAGEVVMIPLELRIAPGTAPVSYLGGDGEEAAEVLVKTVEPPGWELRFRVEFAVE
ncbi:MAG: DUF1573 domain-containing protein [Pirellulales bacterium]|nr:DUF1573 domain-containing protein [Pirellulales bacterium]